MSYIFNLLAASEHLFVALLAIIPGLINLGIFIYSYYFFPKSRLSITFSLITLSALIWQFSEGYLRLTTNLELAERLALIIDSSALLLVAGCLHFSFIFTQLVKVKSNPVLVTLIYLPALIFIILLLLGWVPIEMEYTSTLGFVVITNHLLVTLRSLYISIIGIACAFLLTKYWLTLGPGNEQKKAKLIALGYLIPFTQGLTTEIMFPEIFDLTPVPLTTTSITFFSIGAIIALKKYNLLSFSPYNVSKEIINTMTDAIIISDIHHVIKFINPSFLALFQYHESEVLNKQGYFLLSNQEGVKLASKMNEKRKGGGSDRYEIEMKTKSGNNLTIMVSASPYVSNNQIIGSIAILQDITKEKLMKKEVTRAMIEGEEKERKRLAQELHDGVVQSLSVIKLILKSVKSDQVQQQAQGKFHQINELMDDSIKEIRSISHNLTLLIGNSSLNDTIQRLINRFQTIDIKFDLNVYGTCPPKMDVSVTINIYRVIQEFINNSIKYANTDLIDINIYYKQQFIEINVKDYGCGFDYSNAKNNTHGIGLQNMRQRVEVIGGYFEFKSKINVGTSIKIRTPYHIQ